ncbi:hypothetical protein A2841_03795 [Candidatus Kaiserbacteria bacterium RIFCSPHIGHO2_01_FULL_48_10]|uniref:Glycosyltransferase 2-like domain-containing protein n=1 Tax=Candidatus Kaiserbacteria bacterium RIFCSPHIGHO2_01_FULL_48_10 TaxID=1798476 RepID=A0A1F6C4J5_9BACT|nr:MAG: hypothetical protein A2841_03795 [Candidatus Kaiserbacteria bacterium RIFCSPHIGHO2_01_FULL_48_10]
MNSTFEVVIYIFLFFGLFFEIFLLLTFFEPEAKQRRMKKPNKHFPTVAAIVPCYNEEETIAKTVESLVALEYPQDKLTIVLVDDGSTDRTGRIIDSYGSFPHIKIIHKENGGKHTALNAGIRATETEFVAILDADSFVSRDALKEIMAHFDHERVGAVIAAFSIWNPRSLLEKLQQTEYLLAIAFRHVLSAVNGLSVTPGPLSIFRRQVFEELGTFVPAHDSEDMEMALRMQKAKWHIANAPHARVYTKAPESIAKLIRQRTRWMTGYMRNGFDYREMYGNPHYGALGMLVLPFSTFAILGTIVIFTLTVAQTGKWLWNFFQNALVVPLSFTFHVPSFNFDWFFLPLNTMILLGILAIGILCIRLCAGALLSNTKPSVGMGVVWYLPFYGIVAPIWTIRALRDVVFGIRRSWR